MIEGSCSARNGFIDPTLASSPSPTPIRDELDSDVKNAIFISRSLACLINEDREEPWESAAAEWTDAAERRRSICKSVSRSWLDETAVADWCLDKVDFRFINARAELDDKTDADGSACPGDGHLTKTTQHNYNAIN